MIRQSPEPGHMHMGTHTKVESPLCRVPLYPFLGREGHKSEQGNLANLGDKSTWPFWQSEIYPPSLPLSVPYSVDTVPLSIGQGRDPQNQAGYEAI